MNLIQHCFYFLILAMNLYKDTEQMIQPQKFLTLNRKHIQATISIGP